MGKAKTGKRNAGARSQGPYPTGSGGRGSSGSGGGTGGGGASGAGPSHARARAPIFKFNTKIGQHILKNPGIADRIVEAAKIQPHDAVLEVGPGTGVLTTRLLDRARSVAAVELDPRMAAELSCRVQGTPRQKKLRILLGDFIKLSVDEIPPHDVCVSNTPYQISSPLIFKLLSLPKQPRTAILMLQREFALRLLAKPGDAMYSRLSVNAQFFATVSHVMKVAAKNFTPPPQVESSVVRLEPRPNRPEIAFDEFDGLLRVCFNRKNRTMSASWSVTTVRALMVRNWLTWAAMFPDKISANDRRFLLDPEPEPETEHGQAGGLDVDMLNQPEDQGAASDDDMDVDDDGDDQRGPALVPKSLPPAGAVLTIDSMQVTRGRVDALIRSKVDRVLAETGLAAQRAAKCDENDFLRLLVAFNQEGIHFS